MDNIMAINTPISDFLRQRIIDLPYIYIDYWSIMHFSSGLILGIIFAVYYPRKYAWLCALALLILYEIFEFFLTDIIFAAETLTDRSFDLIVGMVAFFIMSAILRKKSTA